MARVSKTMDAVLELKDAGLVAASAAAQVDSENQILNIGTGNFEGDIVIDVTACEVDSGNEYYRIGAQISSSSTFASDIYEVCSLMLGDADVLGGDTDMGIGRYVLKFHNRIADGTNKGYLRLYTTVGGTVGTGINYSAFITV